MASVTFSEPREELRNSVRFMLGGVDREYLPDGVIDEQADRIVIPFIDKGIDPDNHDQTDIDDAIVAYTADRSLNAIKHRSTVSGGGLTANFSVEQWRREARQRSSEALARIGLVPPDQDRAVPFADGTHGAFRL